jgi:hypothetical protein
MRQGTHWHGCWEAHHECAKVHIERLREAGKWMVALIDGGEQMPKPGDEVAEQLRAAVAVVEK